MEVASYHHAGPSSWSVEGGLIRKSSRFQLESLGHPTVMEVPPIMFSTEVSWRAGDPADVGLEGIFVEGDDAQLRTTFLPLEHKEQSIRNRIRTPGAMST
jgi:hypothetical protein